MKTINSYNLNNKTVLLRIDINSEVKKKKVLMSERIFQAAKTINILKRKNAKIVVIAHQGNPKSEDFVSLRQHAKLLNKYTKIKFINDIIGKKAEVAIKNLRKREAILLENVRFLKDEFNPGKNLFVKKLSSLCDIYINDAFSVCHRKQSSIVSFPKYMKSCAGPLLYEELKALKKIKVKNALYILGGSKPKDEIKLLNKKNKVLVCGLFGQMCLIAKGKDLGAQSIFLKKHIKDFDKIISNLKNKVKDAYTPVDFAVKVNGKRKEFLLEDFPVKYEIFDIGHKTKELYVKEIKKAKAIYMKGVAGFCEEKEFSKGTRSLLNAIIKNKSFSLLGGGSLTSALRRMKIPKKYFNHVSLSGGALARYIAGEKLPGIEALKWYLGTDSILILKKDLDLCKDCFYNNYTIGK